MMKIRNIQLLGQSWWNKLWHIRYLYLYWIYYFLLAFCLNDRMINSLHWFLVMVNFLQMSESNLLLKWTKPFKTRGILLFHVPPVLWVKKEGCLHCFCIKKNVPMYINEGYAWCFFNVCFFKNIDYALEGYLWSVEMLSYVFTITTRKEGMFVSSFLSCTVLGRRMLQTHIKKEF